MYNRHTFLATLYLKSKDFKQLNSEEETHVLVHQAIGRIVSYFSLSI